MSEHDRQPGRRCPALYLVKLGVTDAAGAHLYEDLMIARYRNGKILRLQGFRGFCDIHDISENHRLHIAAVSFRTLQAIVGDDTTPSEENVQTQIALAKHEGVRKVGKLAPSAACQPGLLGRLVGLGYLGTSAGSRATLPEV